MEDDKKEKKKKLGQFMTTNYEYILQGMKIPDKVSLIEPFVGNGDLLKFVKSQHKIECYDLDPKNENTIRRDTLLNPPSYNGKFILTNPPYLARNKSDSKIIFDKYKVNDLYKCFISELLVNTCIGGIIIIPLNFWCSIRDMDIKLRKKFLTIYEVSLINIFEEKVFDDTSYSVCSFQFSLKGSNKEDPIKIIIYPSKKQLDILLNKKNNYIIGGEIYNLPKQTNYKITRLIKGEENEDCITNIKVKCIDNSITKKLGLTIDTVPYYDNTKNKSERSYATLVINPKISLSKQEEIVKKVNNYINKQRELYNSFFMSNYRESNTIARKRISFDLIYEIVGYFLNQD